MTKNEKDRIMTLRTKMSNLMRKKRKISKTEVVIEKMKSEIKNDISIHI